VKEGCAEGDCGACTVVLGELSGEGIRYRAVDSCLIFLPMLQGKQLITVENLKSPVGDLHPVQQAMIDAHGSQCGFCTPGIVMSLYALYKNCTVPTEDVIYKALAGNLCRCTGYKPIIEAAMLACGPGRKSEKPAESEAVAALLKRIPADSMVIATEHQTYYRPATLPEALEVKRLHPDVVVLNGATDVALRVTKKHELLPALLDLSGIEALRSRSEENGSCVVAAGTPVEDFAGLCRDRFPAIAAMLDLFGSLQIRNLATVGGNLGTASPVGDLMPALIAHGASIELRSGRGARRVPASEFVAAYRRTAAAEDELITAVVLPPVTPGTVLKSYKVSRRRDLDIAAVSGAFRLELEGGSRIREVVLAFGGMDNRTRRAERAEAFLRGRSWDRPTVEKAMSVLDDDFTPISDVRGSAAMRRIIARNLLLKFWADSGGKGGGVCR
jgi:xanthine dehydrogenase small subunit